ncbi:MAG: OmpH family outer membrane protein [Blastochloris sp.]|nr:OmpH family outer membrane protein [Blastochloris sp.]
MRTLILSTISLLSLSLASICQAETKIALVDMQEAFKQYYKTNDAQERLKQDMATFQKNFEEKKTDMNKLVDQLNGLIERAKDPSASETAKKEAEQKVREKQQEAAARERELLAFRDQTSKMFQDSQARMRKGIVDEINEAIVTFSKGKYNLVMDKSGMTLNGTPALVYTEGVTDITQEIIKTLNKSKPADAKK